jgi:hypothetical protein
MTAQETAPRLKKGVKALAAYIGLSERETYYLASRGRIPGVFQLGRDYVFDPEIVEEGLKELARSGVKPSKSGEA